MKTKRLVLNYTAPDDFDLYVLSAAIRHVVATDPALKDVSIVTTVGDFR